MARRTVAATRRRRQQPANPEPSDIEEVEVVVPKRRRVQRRAVRGRKGGLKGIINMPLDILFEIFGYLDLADLLHLARTSKDTRVILMNRSSAYIWKAARQNIEGLPQCPPFLSEPAYANLLFSPHCHNCLKGNIHNINWDFYARICRACWDEIIIEDISATSDMFSRNMEFLHVTLRQVLSSENGRGSRFLKPEFDEFVREWNARPNAIARKAKIIDDYKLLKRQRIQYAPPLKAWHDSKRADRTRELDAIRQQRLEMIVERLRTEGWGPEMDIMSGNNYKVLSDVTIVRQAVKLTDRTWPKVRDELTATLEDQRSQRLQKEYEDALSSRFSQLRQTVDDFYNEAPQPADFAYLPKLLDFAMMPEIREVLDVPGSTEVTSDDFLALRDLLPTLINRWRDDVKDKLRRCSGLRPESQASYPEIIDHRCLRQQQYEDRPKERDDFYKKKACGFYRVQGPGIDVWNGSSVALVRRARIILECCGKDPARTTRKEMDEEDFWFKCGRCMRDNGSRVQVMTWREALVHVRMNNNHNKWHLADEKEKEVAKSMQATWDVTFKESRQMSCNWNCARCAKPDGQRQKFDALQKHLRLCHEVEDGSVESGDMFIRPHWSIPRQESVWLVLDKSKPLDHSDKQLRQDGRLRYYSPAKSSSAK
ncbi:hypothetical protein A0H81_04660 [Grifola frondosa]|uniref:F-box domain-containing protein n=1 Tax=Grifola frondosa TaxID=5627 RepID=A0A1C7MKL4_GRIFR|nr:hypothetical protein A0H81_04660 [Grifola frondosa]